MNAQTKKKFKGLMGRAVEAMGLFERNFRSKLIIVTFHRVNDWMAEDAITCSSRKFETFCEFFMKHFTVVSLAEQIVGCQNSKRMGGTLSITFDDGYRDNFDVAAPILCRLGLPATFFVTTGFIDTEYVPPWDKKLARQPGWMSWDQVRALRDQKFDIGAHTAHHIDLGSENPDVIRAELVECRTKLQAELGFSPSLFAYPFGGRRNISQSSVRLVQEAGFECCVSACGGVNGSMSNPFTLNRISVGRWFATPYQLGLEIFMSLA